MGTGTDTVDTRVVTSPPSPPSPPSSPADADGRVLIDTLVARAVNGDGRARDELLALIHPLVLKYCRARLGRQESLMGSADDVAQDVCMAVVSALPHYQLKGLSFRAFVYGLAAHKVTDAFRAIGRNRAEPVADLPDGPVTADGPEHRLLATETSARLGALLGHLTSRQREVIVLRLSAGLSAEETAQALGSTPGAVRVTQHRALVRLRRILLGEPAARVIADPETGDALDKVLDDDPPGGATLGAASGDRLDPEIGIDALEVVDELGTRAMSYLNRSHFLLAELEPGLGPRVPSDRWYRLYVQLEHMRSSPCAVYLLSAAALVDEVHVLAERGQKLARHSRRAFVREQVARHLDAVTPWTTQLLDHACTLSRPDLGDEDRPVGTSPLIATAALLASDR